MTNKDNSQDYFARFSVKSFLGIFGLLGLCLMGISLFTNFNESDRREVPNNETVEQEIAQQEDAEQVRDRELAEFYSEFTREASSLDPDAAAVAYEKLVAEDFSFVGVKDSKSREVINEIHNLNPELFDKLLLSGAGPEETKTAYANILKLSIATGGKSVESVIPVLANSVVIENSASSYTVPRHVLNVVIPEELENRVAPTNSREKSAVVFYTPNGNDGWKIRAHSDLLSEFSVTDVL